MNRIFGNNTYNYAMNYIRKAHYTIMVEYFYTACLKHNYHIILHFAETGM